MAGPGRPGPAKGDPRMIEAGRKGGSTVKATRGPEFFREIGRKGGSTTRERFGPEFFSQIGRKGGSSVKDALGAKFYAAIGKKGGSTPRKRRVPDSEVPFAEGDAQLAADCEDAGMAPEGAGAF